jgi:hypothetical protein
MRQYVSHHRLRHAGSQLGDGSRVVMQAQIPLIERHGDSTQSNPPQRPRLCLYSPPRRHRYCCFRDLIDEVPPRPPARAPQIDHCVQQIVQQRINLLCAIPPVTQSTPDVCRIN